MIVTHTGKLGDFFYCLPVASWIYKQANEKIHFVLPRCFVPFRKIESLLMLQEMTERVSLVDFNVQHYKRGGQPYRLIPACYGIKGEYVNFGFRNYKNRRGPRWLKNDLPDKFITEYYADEWGLGWDKSFVLNLGDIGNIEAPVSTEALNIPAATNAGFVEKIDLENKNILQNLQRMARAERAHCHFSAVAAALYFARVAFTLYRHTNNPPTEYYFPDKSRYTVIKLKKRSKLWAFMN